MNAAAQRQDASADFGAEHCDALQEVVNVAMGRAGATLAELLGVFVRLSVPRVRVQRATRLDAVLAGLIGGNGEVTAVRQAFNARLRGEAIVLFGEAGGAELADLMGYDAELTSPERREILLDIANVLVGACLGGLCEQLDMEPTFSAPSLLAEATPVSALMLPESLEWSHALLVEVSFTLEARGFSSHLLMLMPEGSIGLMREALDRVLEAL